MQTDRLVVYSKMINQIKNYNYISINILNLAIIKIGHGNNFVGSYN